MAQTVGVLATGGKQYLVHPGDTIQIEKLTEAAEATVQFDNLLTGQTITATVVAQTKSPKVSGRIFHNKVRASRYPRGHRQQQTTVRIETIA